MARRKIVHDWMPQDERLNLFYKGINSFLDKNLPELDNEEPFNLKSKIIADPLHGYIQLKSWEVAIIDTKLFQRLRKISQLGLANLVFPSLTYSRFEHSLGVLGTINVLLVKLIENATDDEKSSLKDLIDKYEISLRVAALLHDIGHCLFSHCSERVINDLGGGDNYPSSNEIREIFSSHFKKNKQIPFAEVFAITFLGSKRFSDFMNSLEIPKRSERELNEKLRVAANFILGLPDKNEPKSIFLAQLISSGLDADKIDYMAREALYSGIKLEIDLDRIYSKISVFEVSVDNLPNNLSSLKIWFDPDSKYNVLGLKKGGQFNFEEFCVARLALHVKIYLHQKVRAAEAQLSRYLRVLSRETILEKAHEWLDFPESVIEHEDYILNQLNRKNADLFTAVTKHSTEVSFSKLDNREIINRAFGFGFTNNISFVMDDNGGLDEFDKLFKKLDESEVESKILNAYYDICKLLGELPEKNIHNEIIADFPRYINIQQGHDSLFFPNAAQIPPKWTIPIDKIMIYYQYNRALAYIFAPKKACSKVYIASEYVIYKKTGLVFNTEGVISESILEEVLEFKTKLNSLGYYNKVPQIRPLPNYFNSADANEKIKKVCANLKRFKSHNGEVISINTVTTFINQFPEELQPIALDLITHLKVYDENILAEKIKTVLDSFEDDKMTGLTFIGNQTDSAALYPYHMRGKIDFDKEHIQLSEINDNLITKVDRIIFFDDNINSGLQLINIIGELLGEKSSLPTNLFLNEDHVDELLSEASKEKLRKMPKYFVYTIGVEGIEEKLKKVLDENYNIDKATIKIILHKEISKEEKIFSGLNSTFDYGGKIKLRKFLEDTGEKLLKSEGKTDLKANSCKLGYASAEAMVVFPYNVPTMTITALWCDGEFDGKKWISLTPRRRRRKSGELIGEDY